MATKTINYELVKPGYEDPGDIQVINNNMDIIDGVLNDHETGISSLNERLPDSNGTADQILRSNGDGTTRWDDAATEEEIGSAVSAWLDEHATQSETYIEVEDTLSVSGAAADSKKTGDEIRGIKTAVSNLSATTRNLNTVGCGRYYANTTTGEIGAAGNNYAGLADKLPCDASTDYCVSFYGMTYDVFSCYAVYYDSNGDFVSSTLFNNLTVPSVVFTTPSGAAYMYFFAYSINGITFSNLRIQVEKGNVPTEYIPGIVATDGTAREEAKHLMDLNRAEVPVTETPGYYANDGSIARASTQYEEVYTNKIPVNTVSGLEYSLEYAEAKAMWMCYVLFDRNSDFVSRTVVVNSTAASFSGEIDISDGTGFVAFAYRTFGNADFTLIKKVSAAKVDNEITPVSTIKENTVRSSIGMFPNRFKPFYDHIFIDKITGENVVIPSESLFNIQISRRLGFNMIEANVHQTADNKFVVMHGEGGKFGAQVQHTDGATDISNTAISSVALSWIKTNVRYKSNYAKYMVAPPSLEEFLYECRKNCMIPMVTARSPEAIQIINSIMGKDNYVAYDGIREKTGAPILTYPSLTTKEEILARCESFGVPYMYCMANPGSFTDSQLLDIVNTLHEHGYWIGFAGSYQTEAASQRLFSLGFDFSASKYQINEFETGNLCNLSADVDYSDFTTNGTVADNLLTLATGQTIVPNSSNLQTVFLGGGSLHIRFIGTLRVNMGRYIDSEITSDGSQSLWFSTYYLQREPTFYISAVSETQIINIDFKASKM